ncbi:MAG: hypothetical protein DMG08_03005 [Acidobacteria bacterium]|nr:MAG: hypothetical protein DMG08_03005 [Acidobacteriota bacterium]
MRFARPLSNDLLVAEHRRFRLGLLLTQPLTQRTLEVQGLQRQLTYRWSLVIAARLLLIGLGQRNGTAWTFRPRFDWRRFPSEGVARRTRRRMPA